MISSPNQVEVSEQARRKAKRDHVNWIVWEKDGVSYADKESSGSLTLAIEASGSREFYGMLGSNGDGFIIEPEIAQSMLRQFEASSK